MGTRRCSSFEMRCRIPSEKRSAAFPHNPQTAANTISAQILQQEVVFS